MAGRGQPLSLTAFKSGAALARSLPAPLAASLARTLGNGFGAVTPAKRRMLERHLHRVDPGLEGPLLDKAVRQAFASYARYWMESFRVPHLPAAEIAAQFSTDGFENIRAGLDAGTGVILALPHLGGWEWAGRWLVDQGIGVTVVVEPLQPPELYEWFVGFRESLGMHVVPLGEGAASALTKAIRDNHVVCLLCDRDIKGGGAPVEFFGETTTLPAGPAMLTLRTGAPLLPTAVYFSDRQMGHLAVIRPPVPAERSGDLRADIGRVTQDLAHELEDLIEAAPSQWHLLQPNWPSDPGYRL